MNLPRRALCAGAALAVLAGATSFASPSYAQAWPNKPVKWVVPFPPGGGTDAFARPLAKVVGQALGQTIVIDNRGGAGGTLGAEITAKSPADGYTFMVGAVHHTIAVSMYPKLGYDLQKDLIPVTLVSRVPNVVVVNPSRMPVKDYKEFSEYLKKNPGKTNFASAGNGTSHQLTVEMYKVMTGAFATHIPYRGAGPAMQDLLAGQVDFMFDGLGSSIPQIKAGKLVPIAVTSAARSPALPNIPTLNEVGVKGYDAQTWYAIWAPAGTPRDIVLRMQQEVAKAMGTKEIADLWANLGAEKGGNTPEQLGSFVASEVDKWAKVVKASGAKLD